MGDVLFQRHDCCFVFHVGVAEIDLLLSFGVDCDTVGDHVDLASGQRSNQRGEIERDDFQIDVFPLSKGLDQLDVKADILAIHITGTG